MTQQAVATRTERVIFRCKNKNCKHIWAYEYTSEYGRPLQRYSFGMIVYYSEDLNQGRCPRCNNIFFDANKVQGKVSTRKCNDRCQSATSEICECSCAGANHGIAHL